jgi:hypothetical protein
VHSGANYYWSPNITGNFIQSNVAYSNNNFDTEFNVNLVYSGAVNRVVGCRSIGEGFNVAIGAAGLTIEYKVGATVYVATAAVFNVDNTEYTFRVTRDSATGLFTILRNGVSVAVTGSQIAGALTNLSNNLEINGVLGGIQGCLGKINWVKMYVSGSVVQYFNPSQYNAANSQTQWVSTSGETWTINTGTATTGYKGQIVTKTTIQGDGIDDRLTSGTLATRQYFTRFAAFNPFNLSPTGYIISGNPLETHLIYKSSNQIQLYNTPSQIQVSGSLSNNLQLITGDYNGASSKVRRNNAADVTGTTGAATSTIINLFSSGSGTLPSNAIINTLIDAVAVSNDTQKTAMYNYIRSINGSAF